MRQWLLFIVVLSMAFGCGANEAPKTDWPASVVDTSPAAAAPSASPQAGVPSEQPIASASSPPRVDEAHTTGCRVSYVCSLSHPGLGSYSDEIAVDLESCARTTTTRSGPWEEEPGPPPTQKTATTQLEKTQCAHIASLAEAVTGAERSAQEPAHIDTAACRLSYSCGTTQKYSVQRQTDTGKDHVSALIRALRGAE